MEKFISPFLLAFFLSVFFVWLIYPWAKKILWQGREEPRHLAEKTKAFRIGGIAMILAFILALVLDQNLFLSWEIKGLFLALALILMVGFKDDIKELSWKIHLIFQILLVGLVFLWGIRIEYITNPFSLGIINFSGNGGLLISFLLVLIWILVLMNALNWLDGIDGLSGGTALISALTIFFLSLKPEVNQPPVAILAIALSGAILGFLLFNFYPAKILAGTSGTMFFGFTLAILAIFSGTKIATAILVLFLPLMDFIWVIGERIKEGKSIFKPDQKHLHFKLLELGWSPIKINAFFFSATAIFSLIALNTRILGKSVTLLTAILLMLSFLVFIKKKIKKLSVKV
jgi:UDP-GlcNAc:undecaprenyl-phosphate GlcNAc-1-phosphate transferase